MRRVVLPRDRAEIAKALRVDAKLHLYALGDLDDFFFPHTGWHALEENGELVEIVLVYAAGGLPVVHALSRTPTRMRELIGAVRSRLPRAFYLHASPGVLGAFAPLASHAPHGLHHRMHLADRAPIEAIDVSSTELLGPCHRDEIVAFYARAYPGNWFDPRMLETGAYVGARVDGALASVAGVHVISETHGAAALGNVATLPERRGRGLAAAVTARLCREPLRSIETIGLNVDALNSTPIQLYERLGFVHVADYEEHEAALG